MTVSVVFFNAQKQWKKTTRVASIFVGNCETEKLENNEICISKTNADGFPVWSLFEKQFYPTTRFLKFKFDIDSQSGIFIIFLPL